MRVSRGRVVAVVALLFPVTIALILWYSLARREAHREIVAPPKPEAPPDLEKLRSVFASGLDALSRNDGADAVRHFTSFTFRRRAVEEYRLWFLAQGQQLARNEAGARVALAHLWVRDPKGVFRDTAGATLAALYAGAGDYRHTFETSTTVALHAGSSENAAAARMSAVEAALAAGDPSAVLYAARSLAIKNPATKQGSDAVAIVQSLTSLAPDRPLRLDARERLERAVSYLRDGDAQNCLDELTLLEQIGVPPDLQLPVRLNKGLALNQLRRFEDSNKVLEPLAGGPYRVAIPALYTAAKNYRVLSASINPTVSKVITVRQKVGTVKVRAKGKKKAVVRPKFANVKKTIQLVDLAKKSKKETYDRLATERLKDLLSLPLADEVRIEVLNTLIGAAEAKNQDDYERDLIEQLAKVDATQEAGLQRFWDKAWAAYARGDLNGAVNLFVFIRDNYRNPNVKRQATYWRARAMERLGKKEEAAQAYRLLASAPYADVYVKFAEQRGATHADSTTNPLTMKRADWRDIAEHNMPSELRLAYELTALSDARDARLEIQKNRNRKNQPYADALLADLYNAGGNTLLMMRALRSAFPQLATVEQDSVPPYFLRMYYPLRYEDSIRRNARKNGLDPHLVMGLIHQESYFNPRTRSSAGAIGLMQLMPATGQELGSRVFRTFTVGRLENPDVNIQLGTMHFRHLIDIFGGKTELAIASYNAGQGNVLKWRRATPGKPMDEFLESIPFPETRTYVKRVTMLSTAYARITR